MGTTLVPPTAASAISGLDVGALSVVAVATLILLLVVRESVSARAAGRREDPRLLFLAKILNAPILALLAVFATILVVRIWEIL